MSKENTATDFDRELANLAASDLKVIDELSGWLSAYDYEVNVCGRKGIIERERCESLARVVIKRLSNFL